MQYLFYLIHLQGSYLLYVAMLLFYHLSDNITLPCPLNEISAIIFLLFLQMPLMLYQKQFGTVPLPGLLFPNFFWHGSSSHAHIFSF
jgi:hypothetical protein